MRNLIYFIIRYSALILFLSLELIAFLLIVNYNKSQKEIWAYSSNLLTGSVYKRVENVTDFFDLREVNDSLLTENAKLLETIINYRVNSIDNSFQNYELSDSIKEFKLIPSRVCNKTLNLRNNYITLCKGKSDGINVGMGVITQNGVIGIIKAVSDNFATVLLILNSQSRISAKVNTKNYHGNLIWDTGNTKTISLLDIPKHAAIEVNDSISTSGYSTIFPPDIFIGKIKDIRIVEGSNNYRVMIDLNENISTVENVYVISYLKEKEKEVLLENENE